LVRKFAGPVDVRPGIVQNQAGDRITVPVYLKSEAQIVAMSFELGYDPRVLKAEGVSLTQFSLTHNTIKAALAGRQPLKGPGTMVNLEFKLLATGQPPGTNSFRFKSLTINSETIHTKSINTEFGM